MAETSSVPQHKKQHYHHALTLTTILFFISFLLIFLILLSSENTLNFFLSPSIYRDLFSLSTINPNSNNNVSFQDANFIHNNTLQKTPFLDNNTINASKDPNFVDYIKNQELPISEKLPYDTINPKDSNFIDNIKKQELPISEKFPNDTINGKDPNFIDNSINQELSNLEKWPNDTVNAKDPNFIDNNKNQELPKLEKWPNNSINGKDSSFIDNSVEQESPNLENSGSFTVSASKDPTFVNNIKNQELPISGNAENYASKGPDFSGIKELPISGDEVNNAGIVPVAKNEEKEGKRCNLFMGKWVRDDVYPVYKPGSCPYVDEGFNCQLNGRPDDEYLRWRWKPDDCDLPRFNVTDFLIRLRGKRLMLVGDSMNRNQFESMLCLLREGLPDKSKMYEVHGYRITKGRGFFIFKFVDFNCTIEFVRSHFLVREGTRVSGQGNTNPTLSIDRIDKSAGRWKHADILVFNTGHWWTHGKTSRGKNYYKEGDHIYPQFDSVEAYRRSLKTWALWIDENLNPARQMVFYRAYSSAHYRGGDWDSGGTCNGEKQPIISGSFLDTYPLKMKIVEEVIQQMKVPVVLLNVTRLTNFRKDGHPSIYGKVRAEGTKVSARKQDCSHWCLPGVPDAWNELIYATLVLQQPAITQVQ